MNTQDQREQRAKRYSRMKSIMDIGMGIIYIAVATVILFAKNFHLNSEFADSGIAKAFAYLVLIYGSWRIYRGIKKDYIITKDE
jgi:hypothetical protein